MQVLEAIWVIYQFICTVLVTLVVAKIAIDEYLERTGEDQDDDE